MQAQEFFDFVKSVGPTSDQVDEWLDTLIDAEIDADQRGVNWPEEILEAYSSYESALSNMRVKKSELLSLISEHMPSEERVF